MKYLNPSDLMVGDYVCRLGYGIGKVVEVCATSVLVQLVSDDSIATWAHSIKPIPITAYRLKKNGFLKCIPTPYAAKYVLPLKTNETPQTIIEFTFYGNGINADTLLKCWLKPPSCDGENNIHICDIRYIHELQHNLRNIGLKDVANNFNL